MAKKKERKIFNIDEVNIEIDYDKLAEAIVKANETQTNQYSMSREWMKFIIYPVLWGVAIVTGILAIFFRLGDRWYITYSAQDDTLWYAAADSQYGPYGEAKRLEGKLFTVSSLTNN